MKKFTPSADLIQATKSTIAAKEIVEALRPAISALQYRFLAINHFYDDNEKRIVHPQDMWTVNAISLEKMYKKLDDFYRAEGYELPEEIGYCPLLLAESMLRERILLMNTSAILEMPGMGFTVASIRRNLDAWKRLTDLTIKYV